LTSTFPSINCDFHPAAPTMPALFAFLDVCSRPIVRRPHLAIQPIRRRAEPDLEWTIDHLGSDAILRYVWDRPGNRGAEFFPVRLEGSYAVVEV
jgi:hypothetical protein